MHLKLYWIVIQIIRSILNRKKKKSVPYNIQKGKHQNNGISWCLLLAQNEWTPGVGDGQGAWSAAIHGVAKSRTRLSNWTELNWAVFQEMLCGSSLEWKLPEGWNCCLFDSLFCLQCPRCLALLMSYYIVWSSYNKYLLIKWQNIIYLLQLKNLNSL